MVKIILVLYERIFNGALEGGLKKKKTRPRGSTPSVPALLERLAKSSALILKAAAGSRSLAFDPRRRLSVRVRNLD